MIPFNQFTLGMVEFKQILTEHCRKILSDLDFSTAYLPEYHENQFLKKLVLTVNKEWHF